MRDAPYISLILPAYNEAQQIEKTIREAQLYFTACKFSYEFVVSAVGTDGSLEIVAALAQNDATLKVTGNAERRGKGYGIRQAVPLTTGTIIGFADADNKTPIEEFDKFEPLLQTHDVVIGSRASSQSRIERHQPRYRQIGSKGFGLFMHSIVGLSGINDTQCGFKFFRRSVALDLFSRQKIDGYMFDVEILHLAQKAGYSIAQVPIRWHDDGDSRLQLLSGNVQNVRDIFAIRLASTSRQSMTVTATNPSKSRS